MTAAPATAETIGTQEALREARTALRVCNQHFSQIMGWKPSHPVRASVIDALKAADIALSEAGQST